MPKGRRSFHRWTWPAYRQRLRHSSKPILVGPWLSEVGFEALYWLPFLDALGIPKERLIPITRGGAAVWYGTPTGLEVYAMRSPEDVRVQTKLRAQQTGSVKQHACSRFEQGILTDAAATMGLQRYHVLHPSWMYQTLAPFWMGERGHEWLARRTAFSILPAPPLPGGVTLPERFVAVRFYLRHTLGPHAKPFVKAAVERIAAQVPVVILQSDFMADEHSDLELRGPNITNLRDVATWTPETNLAVQSAVLARSEVFVGTYGGFAQLALRFGRPVVSFYEQWGGTMLAHKYLSDTLALASKIPFHCLDIHQLGLLQSVTPTVVLKAPATGSGGLDRQPVTA